MLYTATLYALLLAGLVPALGFAILHRPNHRFRLTEINASGLVYALAFAYTASLTRAIVLLGVRGAHPGPWWDVLLSLGSLAPIDGLLLVRFFTYLRYLREHPKDPPTAA
ncbi:hypothetical protein ACFYPZ_24480 [Streptomyces sp. NPDC005506]|uniref:hypothetical protein n=1 Tax=Streptomyces sp. NPDC005506 TaxID=3364718 RepID=UPI00368E2198